MTTQYKVLTTQYKVYAITPDGREKLGYTTKGWLNGAASGVDASAKHAAVAEAVEGGCRYCVVEMGETARVVDGDATLWTL